MAIQQRHTNWQQVRNLQCHIYVFYFVHVLYRKLRRTLRPYVAIATYDWPTYVEAMGMRPTVTYTPYATSSKEQTGDVIMFAQFEEGNIWTETRNDTESGDESDNESIMMIEKYMENIDEKENFDDNLISTEMLHDIRDGNQTHPNIDRR